MDPEDNPKELRKILRRIKPMATIYTASARTGRQDDQELINTKFKSEKFEKSQKP